MKTDEELRKQAQVLHDEADNLLYRKNLLENIQKTGQTCISGSYTFNLMVHRDIDIYVQLNIDQDIFRFFSIGKTITDNYEVHKASYSNHFIRHFPGFDHGLYWGILLKSQENIWKIDLWGYGPDYYHEHCVQIQELHKELDKCDRINILRIKDDLWDGDRYRNGTNAYEIYLSVISSKVSSTDQFLAWRNHCNA
jgi:hypothetical protein